MIARVNVNVHKIRANRKNGTDDPPIRIERGRKVTYAREVEIVNGRLVYAPDKPLGCGARVYLEAEDVRVIA